MLKAAADTGYPPPTTTPGTPQSVADYPAPAAPSLAAPQNFLSPAASPLPVPLPNPITNASPVTSGTTPAAWHGGPVQHHPHIYMLYWGPNWVNNWSPISASQTLFGNTSHNGWTNILAQYNDITDQIHPDTFLAGSWQTNDATPSGCVDPTSMESEIEHAVSVRGWSYGADSQFIVWPQPGACVNYSAFGELPPSQPKGACGWHDITPTLQQVYALVPWTGDSGAGCQYGVGTVNSMVGITSHEYAEAASDPEPRENPAWTDGSGTEELADMCSGYGFTPGPAGEYVTYVYSGSQGGCSTSFNIIYNFTFINEHAQGNTSPYMAPRHGYAWWVQIENTSNVPWGVGPGGTVRLGTENPQDRCSSFDDGSWLACNRIAISKNATTQSSSPVEPGQTAEFDFNFMPPAGLAAGTYTENFDPVAEGYTWMTSHGYIWWYLTVGTFGGSYSVQSNAPGDLYAPGMTYTVSVTFTNTGSCPWFGSDNMVVLSTSHPDYRSSAFQATTWPNSFTAAGMAPGGEIDPGLPYTFQFQLTIPLTQPAGTYNEFFDLNANYIGYFTNSNYSVPMTVV